MLVLSRHVGQDITIGPDVVVRIMEIRGGKVKVAIQAPREIAVLRAELAKPIVAGDVLIHAADEVAA
jgi:carbon storage regulator